MFPASRHSLFLFSMQVREVAALHDPCPLPDKQKRRSLNEKERLIYAPMSGE